MHLIFFKFKYHAVKLDSLSLSLILQLNLASNLKFVTGWRLEHGEDSRNPDCSHR